MTPSEQYLKMIELKQAREDLQRLKIKMITKQKREDKEESYATYDKGH